MVGCIRPIRVTYRASDSDCGDLIEPASIGYSPTQGTLEVEFKHGAVYRYLHVPGEVFEAFMAAESKGTFFNHAVKDCYLHQRVTR